MGKTRILGALLCVLCIAVIVLHIYFGYIGAGAAIASVGLSFGLPVTVGVLVVGGLGLWLGWIMATTKEVTLPPVEAKKEETPAETEKK